MLLFLPLNPVRVDSSLLRFVSFLWTNTCSRTFAIMCCHFCLPFEIMWFLHGFVIVMSIVPRTMLGPNYALDESY